MKILLVNTYHYHRGGDATYMFMLADVLRGHGHQVVFFGMRHPLNLPCAQDQYFVDYIDFVEANKKKSLGTAMSVVSRAIYSRQARQKIARLLDDERPDIAHLNNIHAHITPSILFELNKRHIPVVWTLHDYKLICPNTHLLSHGVICERCKGERFYNCTIHRCKKNSIAASILASAEAYTHGFLGIRNLVSRYIAPSSFLLDKFIEFGWNRDRITFLRNALPEDKLNPSIRSQEGNYVLYFGGIEKWKGVGTLIEAAAILPAVKFKIAGDGSQRLELERFIRERNITNVLFVGRLTGNAMDEVLSSASVVAVPSECYENCSYSVMESMAFGKPVVSTKLGGLPELVLDGFTGFHFEARFPQSLATKIALLMKDADLRAAMGKHARAIALREFHPQRYYEGITNVYSDLLQRPTHLPRRSG